MVIRRRKSKDRQYNDQKKIDRGTNNHLQNTAQKIKYWATRNLLKEVRCSGRVCISCSNSGTRRVTVNRHEHNVSRKSCLWTPVYNISKQITNKTWTPYITKGAKYEPNIGLRWIRSGQHNPELKKTQRHVTRRHE